MAGIAGTAFVKADGVQLSVAGTLTVSMAQTEREMLVGLSGVGGHKEMPRAPFIEIEAYADEDTDVDALHAIVNGTVQADLNNGKSYVLRGAVSVTPPEISAADGTFTIRYEGLSGETLDD